MLKAWLKVIRSNGQEKIAKIIIKAQLRVRKEILAIFLNLQAELHLVQKFKAEVKTVII